MKSVNMYIVVDFREGQPSPWEVLLKSGSYEKSIQGKHKAKTVGGLKTYALKLGLQCLRADCYVNVFTLPDGLRDMVLSESPHEMLKQCIEQVSQFSWLRKNDLQPFIRDVQDRLTKA